MRLSATEWAEGPEQDSEGKWLQWGVEQTILLTGELKKLGVDLVDVSSGGNWSAQKVVVGPGYQVRCSLLIKRRKYPFISDTLYLMVPRFPLQKRSKRLIRTSAWVLLG